MDAKKCYSSTEYEKARETVLQHIQRDHNMGDTLRDSNGRTFLCADFRNAIFYQAHFVDNEFLGCDLTNVGANGSLLDNNDFFKNKLDGASYQDVSSSFDVFFDCTMHGSNFSRSVFASSAIQKSSIAACSFVSTLFDASILRDTEIQYATFELCRFRNSLIENIDFRNATLNYTFFDNVKMNKVNLPYLQLPYTFNGLDYAMSTQDDIRIASYANDLGVIDIDHYRSDLPYLATYFSQHDESFPQANCLYALGDEEGALAANEEGISHCLLLHDFRTLYFHCLQAASVFHVDKERRARLYDLINASLGGKSMSLSEQHMFGLYYPRIKEVMIDNPDRKPRLGISLHTTIESTDYQSLCDLMGYVDKVVSLSGIEIDSKHVEVRHNTPFVEDLLAFASPENLQQLATWFSTVAFPLIERAVSDIGGVAGIMSLVHDMRQTRTRNPNSKINREKRPFSKRKEEGDATSSSCKKTEQEAIREEFEKNEADILRTRRGLLERSRETSERYQSEPDTSQHDTMAKELIGEARELAQRNILIDHIEVHYLEDD